jgi:hypothetical protein
LMAKHNKISGQFAARLIEMMESPAYRVLSLSAHRALSRIEIEWAHHGGQDNGQLPVTFDDFERYGVNRHAIGPALAELEALGFIVITEKGKMARAADYRRPNKFLLTSRPANKGVDPLHKWRRFKTMEEAECAAESARKLSGEKKKPPVWKTHQKPVRKTHYNGEKASAENAPLAGAENAPLSISREGTPDIGMADRHLDPQQAMVAKLPWSSPRVVEITDELDRKLNRIIDSSRSSRRTPADALKALEGLLLSNALPDGSVGLGAVH